ncbi:MAG TPA: exonuclease SbcCD subunit D [Jatrophihabitantaceae bacterium]|nr:exonuclease SbcCD subunit D [Jatrophihabitantaceae bacterium]
MKLLHTSDWHLGRTLHGASLIEHQRGFLSWLVELAVRERVDAVLVAGDVYDRAVPPTDAVRLLDDALAAFAAARVPVVLTSGNHDSAIRLGFGRALGRSAGIHLRTDLSALTDPVILRDDAGELAVYGIPYLLPDAVMDELGAERSHTGVLSAAVGRIRADAQQRGIGRVVALAHAFVTGARGCESERDIRVGGIGDAPASVFDGLTYAALGHLHGAQRVGDRVRYCGSPLAFSFSEAAHTKSVSLVAVDASGAVDVELVPAPVPRPLREVRGRLDDLLALDDPELAGAWVKAVLTDARRPMAPMEQLRERWPHTLVLDFQPEGARVEPAADLARLRETTDPVEVCAAFMEWVDSTRPDRAHEDTLRSAVEAVRRLEASA